MNLTGIRIRRVRLIYSSITILLFLIGIALIVVGVVVLKVVLPKRQRYLRNPILQNRFIGRWPNGSLNSLTARWVNPPYRFYTQYWIYNYTNPLEIMNRGAAPDMFEKGPYSYRVSLVNYIEKFSDDGAEVLYRPQSVYHFDKATSCAGCTPSDIFLVPDTVFFKTVNSLTSVEGLKAVLCAKLGDLLCSSANPDALNALTQGIIDNYTEYASIAIKALNAGPLVYTTVDDLLFKGYDDPLFTKVAQFAVDAIQTMSPPLAQMVPENISTPKIHLNNNNDTINPMYTMSTGKKRNKQIGEILSIDVYPNSTDNSNGSSLSTTWWSNPDQKHCPAHIDALARKINGTTGELFRSPIDKTDQLYIYDTNLCRSIPLDYKDKIVIRGISGYRFTVPYSTFNLSTQRNCGFCHRLQYDIFSKRNGSTCLPDGLLDVSRCIKGRLPIAVSNPHFLGASKEVSWTFKRLKPEPAIHQTTFDIEPVTGVLLRSNRRYQLNLMVNRIPHSRTYQGILPATYPIVWINESAVIDESLRNELLNQLETSNGAIEIVCWVVGVGIGLLCLLIAIIMCTYSLCTSIVKKKRAEIDFNFESAPSKVSTPSITDETWIVRKRNVNKNVDVDDSIDYDWSTTGKPEHS